MSEEILETFRCFNCNNYDEEKQNCSKYGKKEPTQHCSFFEMRTFDEKNTTEYIPITINDWKVKQMALENKDRILNVRSSVYQQLLIKERGKATEIIVEEIERERKIYTTRDDEKSEMWIYHEGIYIPNAKTFIQEYCRTVLDKSYTTQLANMVISKIEADTYIDQKTFFNNIIIEEIAVNNGILNLFTKKLKPYDKNKIFFNKIPINYDPSKRCSNVIKHLSNVLKNKEDIPVIQELFGFLLLKEYKIEKAFMMIGTGRNGKGKTLELMKRFIGPENCSNIPLQQFETDLYAKGELFNKMANLGADIDNKALKNTGAFKELTGRDMVSAPRKFLPRVNFVNYAKMIFCANELPKTYDFSPAFFNRWLIIEFPFTFVSQKELDLLDVDEKHLYKLQDPDIIENLINESEMSGLLNWALEGLNNLLQQRDFSYSKNTSEVKDLWIRKSDSLSSFIQDHIVEDFNLKIEKGDFRKNYSLYCKYHKIKPLGDKAILETLGRNLGVIENRVMHDCDFVRCWEGIGYKKGVEDSQGFSSILLNHILQ